MKHVLIIACLFVAMLIFHHCQRPVVCERAPELRYHGADAMTIAWDGTTTAYKWRDNQYQIMWVRNGL